MPKLPRNGSVYDIETNPWSNLTIGQVKNFMGINVTNQSRGEYRPNPTHFPPWEPGQVRG